MIFLPFILCYLWLLISAPYIWEFSPGSRSQVPELMWVRVCGSMAIPTFDNFTRVLSSGSRPSSHYQPEGPKLKDQSRRPFLNPAPTIFPRNCLTKRGICSLSSWLWLILCVSTSLVVVFQSLVSTNRYVSTFFVVIFSSSFSCCFPSRNCNLSLKSAKVAEQARGDPH